MAVPPPQGLTEGDYEAIEAAVTETVRGRWFLSEFARRNRLAETRQLLEAMARIEAVVAAGQVALPSADPSIRLLIQRIKEIAGQLGGVAGEMRAAGIEEEFVAAVEQQARAVSGMMRSAAPVREVKAEPLPKPEPSAVAVPAVTPPALPRMPRADLPPNFAKPVVSSPESAADGDPRLAALSGLDGLSLAKKLALFT